MMELIIGSLVKQALLEDLGSGDLTTRYAVSPDHRGTGKVVAKEGGTIAGLPVAELVFKTMDNRIRFISLVEDGQEVKPGRSLPK